MFNPAQNNFAKVLFIPQTYDQFGHDGINSRFGQSGGYSYSSGSFNDIFGDVFGDIGPREFQPFFLRVEGT